MAKVIEFEAVPTVRGEYHEGSYGCNHDRLTFGDDGVECRDCHRQWKDYLGEAERGAIRG